MGFCLARGFTIHDTIFVYIFDLSKEIPEYPLPEGVVVKPYLLNNSVALPEWQNKGVARNIVCTALDYLKKQGKTIATLGTHGNNKKAINLYTQMGYELHGFRFTVGYEID